MDLVVIGFCAFLTLVNLIILNLNLKLYTEIMKEKSQQNRADTSAAAGSR